MDPLSITTSAITLIQAAGSITTSLCGFISQCRGAESRITSLCDELESLTSGLEAIDRTLKGRNALDLALVEDGLWKQCELALDDCHVTLNSLGVLVHKIRETVRARAWAWRVRAVANLNVYGSDLAAFRDKVHKSNWALQTMLQTINVSLSLRHNASQEAILFELDRLKSSIEEALRASIRPVGAAGFSHRPADHSDARVARNLRNLAQAASHFHGAASSTASTVRDGVPRGGPPRQAFPGADIEASLMGDLPSFRRERVEEYVREGRRHHHHHHHHRRSPSSGPTSPGFSGATDTVPLPGPVTVATAEEDDEDDDAEFERLFLDGLEELAKDRIKERDFDKAVEFLHEAMKREVGSKSDNEGFRGLQVQLALCYLLQRRWGMAEPIIAGLARSKAAADAVVSNLLHTMALVHLSLYLFDKALAVCREALLAKKRLLKRGEIGAEDYAQTQGLLVMIYEMRGDWMHAEVCQSQIPAGFGYRHPRDEVEFITAHPSLLATVLGDDLPDFSAPLPQTAPGLHELDGSGPDANCLAPQPAPAPRRNHSYNGSSPLKLKFTQQLMYESDTSKIVYVVPDTASTAGDTPPTPGPEPSTSGDADDEASPPTTPPEPGSPVRRRISRMLGGRRAQPPPADESPDAPARAATRPAPKLGWVNAVLGLRKPRVLLQKAVARQDGPPGGAPGGFRLLYMERMTPGNAGQVGDPTYRRRYWSPDSFGRCDGSAQEMDAGGGDGVPGQGATECMVALPEDGAGAGNFTCGNGVPYIDVKGPRRPRPQLECVDEVEHTAGDDPAAEATGPKPIPELPPWRDEHLKLPIFCDPHLCRTETEAKDYQYWNTAMRARPSGAGACHAGGDSPTPAGTGSGEDEARVLLTRGEQPGAHTGRRAAAPEDRGRKRGSPPRAAAERADPLLQSLSSVLASLGDITDAEGRHVVKLELEIMALEFRSRFRDGLVSRDLQRAIDSLEGDAVTVPRNENDDSGYESVGGGKEDLKGGRDRPIPNRAVVVPDGGRSQHCADHARPPQERAEQPKMPATPVSPHGEKPHQPRPPLRKRFSFEEDAGEVVDSSHAAAALQALAESGGADAIRSAVEPSTHTHLSPDRAVGRASSLDGAAVRTRGAESPRAASAVPGRPMSVLRRERELRPR